ncbi:MAG: DUF5946 family protein [Sedimentisphaerales bacterium]
MKSQQEVYNDLICYTLSLGDKEFIHQHVVDAYAAQRADMKTKPVTITFALVGLYLYLQKNYNGRHVQLAHVEMAKRKRQWPIFCLPEYRGNITAADVLNAEPGAEREEMIRKWCLSVWDAYKQNHEVVANLVKNSLRK